MWTQKIRNDFDLLSDRHNHRASLHRQVSDPIANTTNLSELT